MSKVEQHFDESGEWHRIGGPAVINPGGVRSWHRHGKRHRRGGPAIVRDKFWYVSRLWYVNGRRLQAAEQLPKAAHPIMELFL